MIKKLGQVLVLAFAINFLLIGGGVGYLVGTKKLDKPKVQAIKEILFPATQPATPATQPAEGEGPTTQPILKLEDLLTRQAGLSAAESVEFIQNTFDTKMAELDRRQRELDDLQRQVEIAKQQLSTDRGKVVEEKKSLDDQKQQSEKLASDKGFQDSLALYTSMPPKQVKSIFLTLSDDTVVRYLQAMQPRQASKILKEFKTPDETSRAQKILEKMRNSQSAALPKE
jgi:flagellar motility protein MotE (MotC chaperone)